MKSDLGSILRAVFGRAVQRRPDRRMNLAIEKLNTATDEVLRKVTIGDVIDGMAKDRNQ